MTSDALVDFFKNDVFKGGVGVVLVGGVLALLRGVPAFLARALIRQVVVSIELHNDTAVYSQFVQWFHSLPQVTNMRSVIARLKDGSLVFSPAPGYHYMRFQNRWIRISVTRKEINAPYGGISQGIAESVVIQYFGRSQGIGRQIVDCVAEHAIALNKERQTIHYFTPNVWVSSSQHRRLTDSICLRDGVLQNIKEDLSKFLADESRYVDMSIPYRRVYLFYGTPGSGKSSLVYGLAGHFGMPIYIGNTSINEMSVTPMLTGIADRSILVFEDIDRSFDKHASPLKDGIRFSSFLNMLDGLNAISGSVVILTANDVSKLDDALIRRANRKIEFFDATREQARDIFLRFFRVRTHWLICFPNVEPVRK